MKTSGVPRDECGWILRGESKKEPEDIVMANMSEQMRLKTLLSVRYFKLPSKLEKENMVGFCVRESNIKTYLFSERINSFLYVKDPRKE